MTAAPAGRRPTGLLLAVVVGMVAVASLASAGRGNDDTAAAELRRRVERAGVPTRFSFVYQRGGTRVLGCVLANTAYAADVDTDTGVLVVRSVNDGGPLAVVTANAILLHRSLFEAPPFEARWLRLPRRPDDAVAGPVRRALGDLASDVFAADLPASGEAITLAALDVATDVRATGASDRDGQRTAGYRIAVDPARFADAAASPTATTMIGDGDMAPVLEVWIGEGGVIRVAVAPRRADGTPGAPEDGWTIEYRRRTRPLTGATPVAADVTDVAAIKHATLAAARRDCRLPG